jgi:hypothetical protein
MKKINKKTKTVAKKNVIKKIAVPKTAKAKIGKKANEGVLGSAFKPQIKNLGIKIPVQAIKSEPVEEVEDFVFNDFEIEAEQNQPVINNNLNFPAIEGLTPDLAEIQPEADNEKAEEYYQQKQMSSRQKNIIMYAGVASIMAVLVVFWGLSIKNSFSQGLGAQQNDNSDSALIGQFQTTLDNLKQNLTNTNQQLPADNNTATLDALKSKINNAKIQDEIANQLKEKLENLNTNSENTNNTNSN